MATQKVDFDVLAHDKASDKLDRIARSFRKLKSDSDNIDGDGLTDLSKKLRKVADDFEKEGDRSGKGFGRGLKKWVTGSGANLGKEGGTVFGSGFLGALKTPILGPALVGVLGATVATALPAVGAVAGGALVTGFGAGIAALGLVFAAKSDEVGKKWSSTMSQLGADMRLLSRPFESTLISIAGFFERTVNNFNPVLAKAFSKMAGPITNFVDQAGRALEKLIPAIDPITNAFNDVLASLGPALQSAVGDLASGMADLARSISENPTALADLVTGLGSLTGTLLSFITTLNDINGGFEKLTGGLSLVEVALGGVQLAIGAIAAPFTLLGGAISGVNALIGRTGKDVEGAGQSMSDAANKTVQLAQGLGSTAAAAKGVSAPVKTAADRVKEAKQAAAEAKQKFEDFITSLFRLQNMALSLSGAQIGLQAAIDDATASIKDNGKTLDINTEKGRANKTALDNVAQAANQQTEAMIRTGKGVAAAAKTAETSRTNFVSLAQKMGLSKTAAENLARKMIAIPNVSREAKLKADKSDLEAKLKTAKQKLADPKLTATKKAKLQADIASLQRSVNAAQAKINSLKGKTVDITINRFVSERISRQQSGATGGHAPGEKRHGGPVRKGQPYIVGEEGPEVMVPATDGTIIPNGATKAASGGLASGGGTTIHITVNGAVDPVSVAQQIQAILLRYKRSQGGGELGLA